MKQLRNGIYFIISILLLIPFKSFSQNLKQKDSLSIELTDAAREIMTGASICALITIDEKGLPMVRPMDPFQPEGDFTVWFGTNPKSSKVAQIKKNPTVSLYYLDSDTTGYVVVHGIAQLVNDQKEKDKYWKPEWKSFYPNKTEDYLLIKVSPKWMEMISYTRGIAGDPVTWQLPAVFFNSGE